MVKQTHEAKFQTRLNQALASDGLIVTQLRSTWPHTLAIYAFGSRIQGQARADSDLDLALLVAGYADPLQCWTTAQELALTLGCDIDLLDLRAASTVMQYQVLTTGQCLWAKQPEASLFECFVMNEKLDFDMARSGLLDDIAQEGKIYGR